MLTQQQIENVDVASVNEDREILLALLDLADQWKPNPLTEVAVLQANAERARTELYHLNREIERLRGCMLWRLIAPVRLVHRWFGQIVRRMAKASD